MRKGIWLWVVVALLLAGVLTPAPARAEHPAEGEPGMLRQSLDYLGRLRMRSPYNEGVHYGAFLGWNSQVYFREFKLSSEELSGHAGAYMQYEGLRLEGFAYFADPFGAGSFGRPPLWNLALSYEVSIGPTDEPSMLQFGLKRNNFAEADPTLGFPSFIDEAFLKLTVWGGKLQGGQSVNMLYTVTAHQRLNGDDGTLIDFGFTTVSQNAWILGDVLSMGMTATWNQRYLQPYGRWSSWKSMVRVIKDIGNEGSESHRGEGPWFLELAAYYVGAFSDRVTDGFVFYVALHFAM